MIELSREEAQGALAVISGATQLAWSQDILVTALDLETQVVPSKLVSALSGLYSVIEERLNALPDEDPEDDLEG